MILTTRAIVNHATTSKYWLRFFSKEGFMCPCRLYPIKSRQHILYECNRFNNYWNPRRDTIAHFTLFLEYNNNTFSFGKGQFTPSHLQQGPIFFFLFLFLYFFSYFSNPYVVSVCMYVATKQLPWSALELCVINC